MPKYNADGMIECPPQMSERWFKKFVARTVTEEVLGQSFTLQSITPSEYYRINAKCGMADDSNREIDRYVDLMLRSVVIDPPEIKAEGLKYFDKRDDIETPELLIQVIDRFLKPGTKRGDGVPASATK